jgi:lysophospholipase L1-like esterase
MLDCLIVGDSIAVGIANVRKECVSYSKGGINSWQWVNKNIQHTPLQAKSVIISLGSNDHKGVKTEKELQTIRELTKADRVYWILPIIKDNKRQDVINIANKYQDTIIDARKHSVSPDKVHPTYSGYKSIAEQTNK